MVNKINIGEHYEYNLVAGEQTLRNNKLGKQEIRIATISTKGMVEIEFKAGLDWLRSHPQSGDFIDNLFSSRGMSLVQPNTQAIEVLPTEQDFKKTALCDKEVLIECIRSGTRFTSELAKQLGKPVAATNSILTSLHKKGILKVNKETEGLKWEIA